MCPLYPTVLCFHGRLFDASSVEGVIENLKKDGSPFAKKQAEVGLEEKRMQ